MASLNCAFVCVDPEEWAFGTAPTRETRSPVMRKWQPSLKGPERESSESLLEI